MGDLMDQIDTWMGKMSAVSDEYAETQSCQDFEKAIARGDRYGVYNPWESYLMNINMAYTRSLYWWAYQQNLYWMSQYCLGYFVSKSRNTNKEYWHFWVYPPDEYDKEGRFFNSVRWEMTRKGLEDYEYLKAVERLTHDFLQTLPVEARKAVTSRAIAMEYAQAVSRDFLIHLDDGVQLLEIKKHLTKEIEMLSKDPVGLLTYSIENDTVNFTALAKPGTRLSLLGQEYTIGHEGFLSISTEKKNSIGAEVTATFVSGEKETSIVKKVLQPL